MADVLQAVKSIRNQKENEPPDQGLTAVKSTKPKAVKQSNEDAQKKHVDSGPSHGIHKPHSPPSSPEDALHLLRSQPDLDQLAAVLKQLHSHGYPKSFNIHAPGPLQAQIINALVNTILPDFWPFAEKAHAKDLLACLANIAGFNAIVSKLRLLSSSGQSKDRDGQQIGDMLDVAGQLFAGSSTLTTVWQNLHAAVPDDVKRNMAWNEFVNLIGSGRVISVVAQAEDQIKSSSTGTIKPGWLASGPQYANWLGSNIADMIAPSSSDDGIVHAASKVLAKALNLGYSGPLLAGFFTQLIPHITAYSNLNNEVRGLLHVLPAHVKTTFIEHLLRWLGSLNPFRPNADGRGPETESNEVPGLAQPILSVLTADQAFVQKLVDFLSDPALCSSLSVDLRRACVAALAATAEEELQSLLEQPMGTFSDQLFINHAPVLQQESLAQLILMLAGKVHSKAPMALLMTARSSNHMHGVSNRLDSSNPRARWLGMIVGTALSSLVDKDGSKMSFGTDDMQTDEAMWYIKLMKVEDRVGSLQDFDGLLNAQKSVAKRTKRPMQQKRSGPVPKINGKPVFGPPRPPVRTEVVGERVTEVIDDEDDDDEDLKPYAKPDSDPEDSDEDATLVNRNKARAPVYVRDLMAMLRDDKDHDRFQLGIKHAAPLIRRKANFGAEVTDHAEELASVLCNLQDPFETDDFDELRLLAMIAVLLSDVATMAPWFSRQAFLGEYSIAQRCQMLSALGLGGRELAGFKNQDQLNPTLDNIDFPSKKLPPHLHAIYSPANASTKRLQAASADIEHQLIRPMALQAADQSTAHLNSVKVRTFSSRMEVERTKRKPAANELAKVFSERFFFPLAGRYEQEIAAYGSASVYSSAPFVLVTFLRTLALLLHASGPATLNLPQVSTEFWELLLSLRVQAVRDISILQAVLFSLLTLLEVNTDKRRIADEHAKQLMETQQWVDLVFERTGGGELVSESGNEDEAKLRTLAAGVLVKTREVIDAYQKQLIGYSGA